MIPFFACVLIGVCVCVLVELVVGLLVERREREEEAWDRADATWGHVGVRE